MNRVTTRLTRRQFVPLASAVATTLPATSLAHVRPGPNDRIEVGVIGLGSRGFNLIDAFLAQPDVHIAAVCDVTPLHYRDRPWGKGTAYGTRPAVARIRRQTKASSGDKPGRAPAVYSDFRKLCERSDLDVVVVATPDHWHAIMALQALRAGKDVYCEKPVTHSWKEGRILCQEVARRNAIFQVGSQQRSMIEFQTAVKLVQSGAIGTIERVEVGLPPGYAKPMGDPTVTKPPAELDYDMWTGPAPMLPYMRARHHRWWRGHRAYGGGVLMDWIGHHNDIAHWGLGKSDSGPTRIEAVEWTPPQTPVYNTPHHYTIRCQYDGGVATTISSRNPIGTKFVGDRGWVAVRRGRLDVSDPGMLESGPPKHMRDGTKIHVRNFLDCVKSRKRNAAPADTGHRSITPGHLGYLSHELGRAIRWDPREQTAVDDDRANQWLQDVAFRSPWTIG